MGECIHEEVGAGPCTPPDLILHLLVRPSELTCVCSLSSVFRFGLITGVFWQVIREKEEARIRVCVPLASSLVDQQQLASPSEGSWQAVLTGHPPPLGSHYTAVPSGSGFIPGPPGHGRVEVSRSGKPRNTTLPLVFESPSAMSDSSKSHGL